ncbi:LRR receptor-like serine/threonine-protein kinase GSO2 [Zea mays]|uniref:LRR receptor-like serine/threonine-protein kinase GSO2 n=1 Tax=Zea mays TaxID=4577 RepID=A0A3L6FRK5_MAIZE|nr:LRR receptor-like serine/threonine-protein kinase GSO2 [Zea mays]
MHPAVKLLILHILAAAFLTSNSLQLRRPTGDGDAASASCIPHERDALLAFKHGISSDPMGLLASWHQKGYGDCCRWRGVRCSNRTGHVLKLRLRNVHVTSSISYSLFRDTALIGHISHSLLALDQLVHLDLSMNNVTGSSGQIPDFLGSLVNLRYLNISGIPFSGTVPPHLGNLSKLMYLDLSSWVFQGQPYSTDISWLAGLSLLEYLDMSKVNLSTVADWAHVVNMIPSLKVLHLSSCSLLSANQTLPRINLTDLETLDLSGNIFDHPMSSSWLWNLTSLQYLNLEANHFYGQVPDALGDMASLQVLDLSGNRHMGTMTTSLKKLCNLTVLDLCFCNSNGDIKELIEQMPQCRKNKLQQLHLGYNNITGMMPSQIAHLTSLVVLDISSNNLNGIIPSVMGQLASLSTLDLSSNYLSGHVPSEIGMLANLTVLDLEGNELNGSITEKHFAKLAKLKHLYLSGNSLSFAVSSEWFPTFSLEDAKLEQCQIGPRFPSWLQFQVNILWVDISSTGLVDKLPDWFSTTFSKATHLDISHNQIHGRLPKNMEFMSLEWFYLSSNNLTGEIPLLPKNISMLDLSLNSLSGNLPTKFRTRQLLSLDLFSNRLTGGLPESICEAQGLTELNLGNNLFEAELPGCFHTTALRFLLIGNNSFSGDFPEFLQNSNQLEFIDLSRNKFSGNLPHWIGGLVQLRFLHLSENMFAGNIPISIKNLTHLHHLNLANNRLSGAIPWGLSSLTAMTRKYVKKADIDGYPYGGYEYFSREIGQYFSVVTKGQQLYYGIKIFEMVSIDLSNNNLSGRIPEEIASLDALLNLNLSRNYLSGEIPDKIGAMKSLFSLDLSDNVLSGEIPSSLSDLAQLSYLDLSNNNLTGPSTRLCTVAIVVYVGILLGRSVQEAIHQGNMSMNMVLS